MKKEYVTLQKIFFSMVFFAFIFLSPHGAQGMQQEDVLRYLGTVENDICRKISDVEGEYFCLSFEKEGSQDKFYLWAERYIFTNFEPKKDIDLLVAYLLDEDTNYFLASMPNPPKASITTQEVTFLGRDNDAPSGGYFMFTLANGDSATYRCLKDFCGDMYDYINKNMEIQLKETHFYHEGAEGYVTQTFIQGFIPIAP